MPPGVSDEDAARQIGKNENRLAWKDNLKMDQSWNYQQKTNYRRLLQHHKPEEYKKLQRAYFQKQLEALDC